MEVKADGNSPPEADRPEPTPGRGHAFPVFSGEPVDVPIGEACPGVAPVDPNHELARSLI